MESYDIKSGKSFIESTSGAIVILCDDAIRAEFESEITSQYEKFDKNSPKSSLFSKLILWTDEYQKSYKSNITLLIWLKEEPRNNKYPVITLTGFSNSNKKKLLKQWCAKYYMDVDDSAWDYIVSKFNDIKSAQNYIYWHNLHHGKVDAENLDAENENLFNIFEFHKRVVTRKTKLEKELNSLLKENPPLKILATLITLTRELAQAYVILASGCSDNDLISHFGESKMTKGKLYNIKNNVKIASYNDFCYLLYCLQQIDNDIKTGWLDAEMTLKKYLKMYLTSR